MVCNLLFIFHKVQPLWYDQIILVLEFSVRNAPTLHMKPMMESLVGHSRRKMRTSSTITLCVTAWFTSWVIKVVEELHTVCERYSE